MSILIENRQKKLKIDLRRIRSSLKIICKAINCGDKDLSIVFTDDDDIQRINKAYLNRDHPTNVMAFPMMEGAFNNVNSSVLGDIIISVETAYRDALVGDMEFLDEVEYLLIHGLLHLLGYDHENVPDTKADEMKQLSNKLFFQLRGYQLI
ncbi:MAG: rRNA maturation RNase YbeY [Syntrophaceae bacterium]|nr:rRNA maturation RNase YbeY [Syntrophaceae bacterium]